MRNRKIFSREIKIAKFENAKKSKSENSKKESVRNFAARSQQISPLKAELFATQKP